MAPLRQASLLVGLESSRSFHETGGAARSAGFRALQQDAALKLPASTCSTLRFLIPAECGFLVDKIINKIPVISGQ